MCEYTITAGPLGEMRVAFTDHGDGSPASNGAASAAMALYERLRHAGQHAGFWVAGRLAHGYDLTTTPARAAALSPFPAGVQAAIAARQAEARTPAYQRGRVAAQTAWANRWTLAAPGPR